MNRHRYRLMLLATVSVLGLALVGCAGTSHVENRRQADERYQKMRARLMLPLAQQQFEAGDLDQVDRTIVEALRIDSANGDFHVLAGRVAVERDRLERALHLFQHAIEVDSELAPAHYYRGLVLQRWRRYESAATSYRKAYKLEPDRPAYLLALGEMLVALDRTDEALDLLQSKLTYFEHNVGLRVAIGQLYAITGDHDQAAMFLNEAHLLHPDDHQIQEDLAIAQLTAGKYESAIRHLLELTQKPSHRNRKDLAHAMAKAYLEVRNTAAARAIYLRLARDKSDDEAWIKLGELAWSAGDTLGALSAAKHVMGLAPHREEGYLLAGMVWQERGQFQEALRMYQKGAVQVPTSATSVLMRGLALEKAGQIEEAANAYREALHRQPDDIRATALLAKLRSREP